MGSMSFVMSATNYGVEIYAGRLIADYFLQKAFPLRTMQKGIPISTQTSVYGIEWLEVVSELIII